MLFRRWRLDHEGRRFVLQPFELFHFLFPRLHIVKLTAVAHYVQPLRLGQGLVHHFVEHLDGAVRDVVVRGDAAEVCLVERAVALVEPSHARLLELLGGTAHQVISVALQQRVAEQSVVPNPVRHRVAQHPHVLVGVAQPGHSFLDRRHRAQYNLGVEEVGQAR